MKIIPDIKYTENLKNVIKTTPIISIREKTPYSVFQNINVYCNYIIPMQRNNFNTKVIIHAMNSKQAMEIAIREFNGDGWIIDREHYKYKKI